MKNKTYSYLVFSLNEKTEEISLAHTAPRRTEHSQLVDILTKEFKNDIAWGVVLVEYRLVDDQLGPVGYREKMVFFTWVPDSLSRGNMKEACRIKMIGSGSIGFILNTLKTSAKTADIPFTLQCADASDITWDVFVTKASKFEMAKLDTTWLPWQHLNDFGRHGAE